MPSRKFLVACAALLAFTSCLPLRAQTPAAPAGPAAEASPPADFKTLIDRISAKLQAGARAEKDFGPELAEFDPLIAKHAKDRPDDAAMLTVMKARLYLEIFANPTKALAILKQLKVDYPTSEVAGHLDQVIPSLEAKIAAEARFALGAIFPNFTESDLAGQPLDLAAYKGKVVLVDFWATWCGPCVAELPNVLAAYEKFHAKGFEIIGISLDKDRATLEAFLKERHVGWRQYFDGLGWENKVSSRYGIDSIPATFLLDGEGRIIAKDLRGDALDGKLSSVLAK